MSFRIQKSHKFTDQFPASKDTNDDDLLSEDYNILFGISSTRPSSTDSVKSRIGGNYIRSVNAAQADYY